MFPDKSLGFKLEYVDFEQMRLFACVKSVFKTP